MVMKKAFTLAEVLITLGIIGVVATITIPSLISKYEKHIIEVGFKKTYSDLYNAIKRSEVDNGSFEQWDYSIGSEAFVQRYLAPYIEMKGPVYKCFAGNNKGDPYCMWKNPSGAFDTEGCWRVAPKYILKDGRSLALQAVGHVAVDNTNYVEIVVDVNGGRGKSIMGQDVFMFSLSNYYRYGNPKLPVKGFNLGTPVNSGDWTWSTEDLKQACGSNNSRKCGLLIQRNNWKFPDDYPIKF
jgi:prepilin-type N-terminal cleavage/methylation domain-containing protein